MTRISNSRGLRTLHDLPCGIQVTTSARSGLESIACILAGKLGTRARGVSGVRGSSSGVREWSR